MADSTADLMVSQMAASMDMMLVDYLVALKVGYLVQSMVDS